MISIKTGVTPPNLVVCAAAANAGIDLGIDIVVTSGTDGKHMVGSKHYLGAALDLRLVGTLTPKFIDRLKARLGTGYQVILESDHIHVEFDPR